MTRRWTFPIAFALAAAMVCSSVVTVAVHAQAKDKDKKAPAKPAPAKPKSKLGADAEPIHAAAFDGDTATMKKLLAAKDVDVNARTKVRNFGDFTALHLAAYEGHEKIIDLLVAKNADLNLIEKKNKRTALHLAAAYGRTDAVKSLIKAGADLNLKDKIGNTALKLASEKAIIAELKKAGAME